MTIEEKRKRLQEISDKLGEFAALENFTEEDANTVNDLNVEFKNIKRDIETKETLEAMKTDLNAGSRKTAPINSVKVVDNTVYGFNNAGEFFMAVKNSSRGTVDRRLQNTHFEKVAEDGGFLIPDEFATGINKKIQGDDALLSRTRTMVTSANNMTLNLDQNNPWSGGIEAYWTAEGVAHTESKHSFSQVSWRLNKLSAMVTATDELLDDASMLESYIKEMAPVAITQKLNDAIISGDGVGKPKGILNSGFKVTIAKEVGQAADTILAKNVIKMYSALLPDARKNAVWLINPECETQLRLMEAPDGSFIYLAPGSQMNNSPYGMLMGLPVMPLLGGMKKLGDEGDIILADLSYYYSLLKSSGIKSDVSTHLYFDKDISAFKFILRVDGRCPYETPVSPQYGTYEMSAFITLAER